MAKTVGNRLGDTEDLHRNAFDSDRGYNPDSCETAFAAIREALGSRHLLRIFPEGHLAHDGEIDVFRPGIERIVGETPVPVVPMALRSL